MALKIIINVSKKVPIPGVDFSSQTASCSIEAESTGQDPVAEAHDLYLKAEEAVDRQLRIQPTAAPPVRQQSPSRTPQPSQGRPYRQEGNARQIPPATASQLRFLRRLVKDQGLEEREIAAQHQVDSLEALNVKQASQAIDRLKPQNQGVGR